MSPITITLTTAEAEGLVDLIGYAARGREDFTHQASYGDYDAADIAQADARWNRAQAAAHALSNQQ